jgi:Domain of unknown function (DUF4412)
MVSMKALTAVLLAATLTVAARADLTITQQIQKEAPPQNVNMTMTMKIKEGKMRLDLNPEISSIVDLKTGDMVSLMHPQKLAMTIPGASIKGMQENYKKDAAKSAGGSPAPKPTGRKETISGFVCEEFETTANGMNVQLWLTKDLPDAEKLMSQLSELAGDADPLKAVTKDRQLPGFPIRTVVDGSGAGKTTVTVLAVSESPVADSEFVVPDGYRAMQTPKLPGK